MLYIWPSKINSPQLLLDYLNGIKYGYQDSKGNRIENFDEKYADHFSKNYRLQTPLETLNRKLGVCYDLTELERSWFKNKKYEFHIYYMELQNFSNHTFLVFKKNNKYYWFEYSWGPYRGIHEYKTLKELLSDVVSKHQEANNDSRPLATLTELKDTPKYHISSDEFVDFSRNQPKVSTKF